MFLPQVYGRQSREEPHSGRIAEALRPRQKKPHEGPAEPPQETRLDATLSFSSREVLQHADFETMTSEELAQAKKLIANLRLPIPEIRTRRFQPDLHGARVDLRASLRPSRRVLGQNGVVLMISDGLDGDVGEGLAKQMERLHKSCRKLLWLIRCCATKGSKRGRRACARCCRTWTSSCRCTMWRA